MGAITRYFVWSDKLGKFIEVDPVVYHDESRWESDWIKNTVIARPDIGPDYVLWFYDIDFVNVSESVIGKLQGLFQILKEQSLVNYSKF